MILSAAAILLFYGLVILFAWLAWLRWPPYPMKTAGNSLFFSVLVPVRNEAANINALLEGLSAQTYRNFEVIVIDDDSEDDTVEIVEKYALKCGFPIKLLRLTQDRMLGKAHKKSALNMGIAQAKGDRIVTTDGDCTVSPAWLAVLAGFIENEKAVMVSAPVRIAGVGWWVKLQSVEFSPLIGCGALAMRAGKPLMCNGANLCYSKEAFMAVGGFEGITALASGDDEMLMRKIAARYPGQVKFLNSPEAIVETKAQKDVNSFYHQRIRWAGKWGHKANTVSLLAGAFVFAANLSPLVLLCTAFFWPSEAVWCFSGIGLKLLPEHFLLRSFCKSFGIRAGVFFIVLTQFIYPFYAVFFGLTSLFAKKYTWKNREST